MGQRIKVILSGGQTGVDQAALRAATAAGILAAGWCPPHRSCDGGQIPADLPLTPTPGDRSPNAPDIPRSLRTEWNVRDSDGTLVLLPSGSRPDAGTQWTIDACRRLGRPLLAVDPKDHGSQPQVMRWLAANDVRILNIAGPSEGTCPGIGALAGPFLEGLLRRLTGC